MMALWFSFLLFYLATSPGGSRLPEAEARKQRHQTQFAISIRRGPMEAVCMSVPTVSQERRLIPMPKAAHSNG